MLAGKLAQREAEAVVHAAHGRDVLVRRATTHASTSCPEMTDRLARALAQHRERLAIDANTFLADPAVATRTRARAIEGGRVDLAHELGRLP